MNRIDGREIRRALSLEADVVIVGSGPAGASVAREASLAGASVIVVEEGHFHAPSDFAIGAFDAMANTYRDMGASVVLGSAPTPFVQGKLVGGSSPINGAISWRMPRDVHAEWLVKDSALADALPWDVLEATTDMLEARLNVRPTDPAIAGAKNQLLARGMPVAQVVVEGAKRRLRPVMMTANIAAFGLVPLLFASGPGSEIQRPLAIVVIGGLFSCTALTLLVLPILFRRYGVAK